MTFMNENFLLNSNLAEHLYSEYAEGLPIIDYHCHIDPEEIASDREYENITQIMLGGDHYKWRLMRTAGISEDKITGDASDKDKFTAFASILPMAIGNPIYHWTHIELKKYFGYEGLLNGDTAEDVWELCNKVISDEGLTARKIIEMSNVEVICTTDDTIDNLTPHERCEADDNLKVKVVPAFRPDKAIKIKAGGFAEYMLKLGKAAGVQIKDMDSLYEALSARIDHFDSHGCRISDHGLDTIVYREAKASELDSILAKGLAGKCLTKDDEEAYITAVMVFLGKEYARRNWIMQLHYGALRNVNTNMFRSLGPDTGHDCIGETACVNALARYLDALNSEDMLPKTIVYSLDGNDNAVLDTLIGCFQTGKAKGWLQHGAAWWFNDTLYGMRDHLQNFAAHSVLGTFVGMLTDSRCFLSFSRHDYFRRLLCNWIAELVISGQYPGDKKSLKELIENISYYNAKNYFGLE